MPIYVASSWGNNSADQIKLFITTRDKDVFFNIVKGDRAFMIAGPKVWNSLPSNIRAITNLLDFKKKLKTFFYRKAFM